MTPWQVKIAQARMAGPVFPVFDQRAYRDEHDDVRFYPSMALYGASGDWCGKTIFGERVCIETEDTRLSDAEAQAIWATRPGNKATLTS